ncbi:39S ribosomal protein L17, mitochondrial-like [Eptesicus fuscus]|uniref:39S ribosomal protein L17, mitochondrial-like n=1 Tax=Eptesicus fuscus TaxID=29078 RepID=UPI0024042E77|nr:39S ribosomal protein L17, mitochondrial-like [Eptesicus fuscus]
MQLSVAAAISHGRVFRSLGLGAESRIHLLRNLLRGLVRHERIEGSWAGMDEMRGYAEKLIDYGKLGDTNERAMRRADFWLSEKDLIPKLFQVLAPRYQGQNGGYTRVLQIPNRNKQDGAKTAVIQYKGNCLPPLPLPRRDSNLTLLNQLLRGLQQDQEASIHSSHTPQTPGILTGAKACVASSVPMIIGLWIASSLRTGARVVEWTVLMEPSPVG